MFGIGNMHKIYSNFNHTLKGFDYYYDYDVIWVEAKKPVHSFNYIHKLDAVNKT